MELSPVGDLEPFDGDHGVLPAPAPPDDQVARAIFEARGIAAAFIRLGREARPQLAWRCAQTGEGITQALHRYFRETE